MHIRLIIKRTNNTSINSLLLRITKTLKRTLSNISIKDLIQSINTNSLTSTSSSQTNSIIQPTRLRNNSTLIRISIKEHSSSIIYCLLLILSQLLGFLNSLIIQVLTLIHIRSSTSLISNSLLTLTTHKSLINPTHLRLTILTIRRIHILLKSINILRRSTILLNVLKDSITALLSNLLKDLTSQRSILIFVLKILLSHLRIIVLFTTRNSLLRRILKKSSRRSRINITTTKIIRSRTTSRLLLKRIRQTKSLTSSLITTTSITLIIITQELVKRININTNRRRTITSLSNLTISKDTRVNHTCYFSRLKLKRLTLSIIERTNRRETRLTQHRINILHDLIRARLIPIKISSSNFIGSLRHRTISSATITLLRILLNPIPRRRPS